MPVVRVEVEAGQVELAADALWQAGPSAVSEAWLDDGRVCLTADVADVAEVGPGWPVQVVDVDADADLDAWRAFARAHRAGRHLVLQPAWLPAEEAGPLDVVVTLEPGRTFGSGSHPTTRLVASVLEDRVAGGEQVLDVGCGSGVLAVVAGRLGAARAVAIDIEAEAVVVTRANALANGLADRVAASTTPVEQVEGHFDLVLANLGPALLRDLATAIAARVAPAGVLVLAGVLDQQVPEVLAAYPGWSVAEVRSLDGWAAPVLTR